MKKKILFLIFFAVASVSILNFYSPPSETTNSAIPPPVSSDKFLLGIIHSYSLVDFDTLGAFNTTHYYIGTAEKGPWPKDPNRHTPFGQIIDNDYLYNDVNTSGIQTRLAEIYGQNYCKVLWMRPKIEWLAYGQRSIYKCNKDHIDTDYWFYAFNNHNAGLYGQDYQEANGDWVWCCLKFSGMSWPDWAVRRLKCNTEQCMRIEGEPPDVINHWAGDSECDWYVKPRIRADVNFITNPNNADAEICKVYIIKDDGTNKITPVSIKAKHFQRNYLPENLYDGRYLEEFYFTENQDPYAISFHGDLGSNWGFTARGNALTDDWCNRADIKVWWSNNCTMWIDYVKVENDVADRLFKDYYDDPSHPENRWIKNEVDAVMNSGYSDAVYNFYLEIPSFNNIPCIGYLNKKIQQYSGGKFGLMGEMAANFNTDLSWSERGSIVSPAQMKRMFTDSSSSNCVFLGDPYPIPADEPQNCNGGAPYQYNKVPSTLINTTTSGDMFTITTPANYDAWLQGLLDTVCIQFEGGAWPHEQFWAERLMGDYQYLMKRGNGVSKLSNKPFIAMLQAHQWMSTWNDHGVLKPGEIDREPSNEELNMMTNVAASYGARGLLYFWYPSFNYPESEYYPPSKQPLDDGDYGVGMTYGWGTGLIGANFYEETKPKWETLRDISDRMQNKWGPALMSFDNTNRYSYIYEFENERNALIDNSYFRWLLTYKPGYPQTYCNEWLNPELPDAPVDPGLIYDCKEYTYLQVATFKEGVPKSPPYFMIVNRRCSPHRDEISENGGRRKVRVLFDNSHPSINSYYNWNIIDVATGDVVDNFNRLENKWVNLDWFRGKEEARGIGISDWRFRI